MFYLANLIVSRTGFHAAIVMVSTLGICGSLVVFRWIGMLPSWFTRVSIAIPMLLSILTAFKSRQSMSEVVGLLQQAAALNQAQLELLHQGTAEKTAYLLAVGTACSFAVFLLVWQLSPNPNNSGTTTKEKDSEPV